MSSASTSRPYHHGRLREALVDAGVALARTEGPEAVCCVPRRGTPGVSHNAAYRHFADRDELLRAVCERCMSKLATLMERADRRGACERLIPVDGRVGPAWPHSAAPTSSSRRASRVGSAPRSRCRGATHTFAAGEGVGASGLGPYGLLAARLDELVDGRRDDAATSSGR